MDFDIHQFDDVSPDSVETEFTEFREALVKLFAQSPEGLELQKTVPCIGRWADALMYYGYQYEGESLPEMTVGTVRNVIYDLFPRKISLASPDQADTIIPELTAFWNYLKREFRLRRADAILQVLAEAEPEFPDIMTDPANFGIAKSFFTMGQEAGFDMTTEDGLQAFMLAFNKGILENKLQAPVFTEPFENRQKTTVFPKPWLRHDPADTEFKSNAARKAQKRKRKQAEQAKKRNRKRGK